MRLQEIEKTMKGNEKYAKLLEDYDRTGRFPLKKIRRSFTIRQKTIDALKKESLRKKESMSNLIDEIVERCIKER
ncbi:MAG: hypothetical protein HZB67_06170 [Candidatus Aenigmarchaeota archaeon]|nr:hypothetical protein [Candidatus Aenigmarchaeota archaeon]